MGCQILAEIGACIISWYSRLTYKKINTPSRKKEFTMPRKRNERAHSNRNCEESTGDTLVGVHLRGVEQTEAVMADIKGLCDKWNPSDYRSIPPLETWALCLGVEPCSLSAKFIHRRQRVDIMLDVANDEFTPESENPSNN